MKMFRYLFSDYGDLTYMGVRVATTQSDREYEKIEVFHQDVFTQIFVQLLPLYKGS